MCIFNVSVLPRRMSASSASFNIATYLKLLKSRWFIADKIRTRQRMYFRSKIAFLRAKIPAGWKRGRKWPLDAVSLPRWLYLNYLLSIQ